jgi:hypothetical protein
MLIILANILLSFQLLHIKLETVCRQKVIAPAAKGSEGLRHTCRSEAWAACVPKEGAGGRNDRMRLRAPATVLDGKPALAGERQQL